VATLEELQTRKAAYLAAELKILQAQEYTISGDASSRRMRRAELEQVRAAISEIDGQIAALGGGTTRPRPVYHVRACR
jgi:hypothetical protein